MVPESFATLYALLGLVAPGLTYQLVTERTRPSRAESVFRETSVVAVTSFVFTTLSVLLLALASAIVPSLFVDLDDWLDQGNRYVADHIWLVTASVAIEVLLAVGLAALSAWQVSKNSKASKASIAKASVWHQALRGDTPDDKAAWVVADLLDGGRVWGYIHYFTTEDIGGDRDISFEGPGLSIQARGRERIEEDYYKYIVVSASQIRMLKVAHENKKPEVR